MGAIGGIRIAVLEVKFLDFCKTNSCESVCQGRFRRSRTKVGGSKTIRYRPSLNHKRCRLGIGGCFFNDPAGTLREIKVFGFRGEYGRKAET